MGSGSVHIHTHQHTRTNSLTHRHHFEMHLFGIRGAQNKHIHLKLKLKHFYENHIFSIYCLRGEMHTLISLQLVFRKPPLAWEAQISLTPITELTTYFWVRLPYVGVFLWHKSTSSQQTTGTDKSGVSSGWHVYVTAVVTLDGSSVKEAPTVTCIRGVSL